MTILTGCLLLLASIAGHTEYWVMLVNRTHSLGISYLILKAFRKLHDLAVVLFAAFVIWKLGVCPNGLLTGGTFAGQPRWAQNLLLFTIPGTIPLIVGILRWHLVMKRDFHRTDSSRTYDVSAPAVTPSAGNNVKGTRMHLSRLFPLNEIYHLQINEKSVHLSGEVGRSSEFRQEVKNTSPIRIVHFSDLHFVGCPGEGYYQWLFDRAMEMKPDVFAFTGDLIDDPTLLPLACRLLKPLTEIAPCFFVLGNHDWRFDSSEIRKQVEQTGWIDVSGNAITLKLADRNIVICGTERPWLGKAPPVVQQHTADLKLLLSHGPDQLRFAQRSGFNLMLAGHTHGGQVVLPVIGPVFAPSWYGVRYASGLFRIDTLNLHVSRGVGGKDPMRWRCPPELTCLNVFVD